jgi:60 kDa SS-A/Ro ribonucleoprotein
MKYNKNVVSEVTHVTTHQGGVGFSQKPSVELVGLLATGLADHFYEKESDREKRFVEIFNEVAKKDKVFAAKALVYARSVMGQRSITHRGAVEIIKHLSGDTLAKSFFSKRDKKAQRGGIIFRLDDMAEILACYQAKNGTNAPIPNCIKKGFKSAIEHADRYELAKYQMRGKGVSLVDIVNLVRPSETKVQGTLLVEKEVYAKAIKGTKFAKEVDKHIIGENLMDEVVEISTLHALIIGLLKQFNTVEDKNTEAGKVVAEKVKSGEITAEQAAVELNEAKTENYVELIKTKKIGYLALLRNLRNILKTVNAELKTLACDLLVDPNFVKNSLVFPYQIDLALEILMLEFKNSDAAGIFNALNKAYELSIPNLKELFPFGKTAVVTDVSGSMSTHIKLGERQQGLADALNKGALISATLAKGLDADVYVFASSAAQVKVNTNDSVNTIKNHIGRGPGVGGGTSWNTIFPELEKSGVQYDRVFIMSDEQGADEVESTYKRYCQKFGTPHVYVINLCGYGPTMIKANTKVHRIFGYHAGIFETARQTEINPEAVIEEINKIVI